MTEPPLKRVKKRNAIPSNTSTDRRNKAKKVKKPRTVLDKVVWAIRDLRRAGGSSGQVMSTRDCFSFSFISPLFSPFLHYFCHFRQSCKNLQRANERVEHQCLDMFSIFEAIKKKLLEEFEVEGNQVKRALKKGRVRLLVPRFLLFHYS